MSAIVQRAFLRAENVLVQSKRFRGKINIQRPRAPHFDRALFNEVARPIFKQVNAIEVCQQRLKEKRLSRQFDVKKPHPYQTILAKELFQFFDEAKMILICQKNSMDAYEFFKFRVGMHQKNIKTKVHGTKVMEEAIGDTKYRIVLPLMTTTSFNCMLFSSEPNIADALAVLRKTPAMILLAGILDDRLMSKNELISYSKMDLTKTRAQFAATLDAAGGQVIVNHLQAHQSNLCYLLDAHAKGLGNKNKRSTDESQNQNETCAEKEKSK